MFRLSQFMRMLTAPASAQPTKNPPPPGGGPVVIWNLVRRCNLSCLHCYSFSADHDFPGELSTAEAFRVLDDLKAAGVSVLILSGGEPLMRPDLFDITRRAKALGFYVGLSSNGTLIDRTRVAAIAAAGYDYVGVSLDGLAPTHDRFRRRAGAFDEALQGIRLCRDAGLRVGLRLTLTEQTAADLPALLALMAEERIDKFYLSHLNYAGRGNAHRRMDAMKETTRVAMGRLFETALADARAGRPREIVTGNNDADGAFLLMWAAERFPDRRAALERRLVRWGGNASGVGIANIDTQGDVHPDTMWGHHTLGNIRARRFADIWNDRSDPILAGLKQRPRPVGGRCAGCRFLAICNGNTRVRAEKLTGDPWAEDPGCYLTAAEIGTPAG
ncbi:heme d1 biosynthesis radical SAM protein NirJ [Azospirillum sp. YIM B02556]|uniref:Heme d1 biosynthesis radical SAM protein NirJ n=1 Tax=Azospirillum endophyticum TaxID=2800326 RepID=A0ABS1FAE7_9PROT|nr:heme d1 biosynthesis radical SAM protein NirJ [Azospirillum endophyticum]MBK1840396.1 heme d1 biosynthesis radical SAM protein NirJ [Azospirillum endophyticum]